jgi:hypothetical protein
MMMDDVSGCCLVSSCDFQSGEMSSLRPALCESRMIIGAMIFCECQLRREYSMRWKFCQPDFAALVLAGCLFRNSDE